MSLFFKSEKRSAPSWTDWWGAGGDSSVTETRATHLVPVFASIRHIVDYVSTLPTDFFRRNDDGTRTQVGPPELIRNLDDEYGIGTWLGQLAYGIVTRGNAVGEATAFSGYALPTMIRWSGSWSGGDNALFVLDGKWVPDRKVVHVPWLVPPGKRLGLSPIEHFAALVSAGLSAQEYADVGRGGGLPPAILKNNRLQLDPEASRAIQDAAVKSFATGKPFVSGNDWDLTALTIPPNHAQFIETLKLSATGIASIYGIDPREIGGEASESLTYTNDESRALNRAHNNRPYLVRIEQAISRLLPEKQFMKFNIDATIRTDIKTRTEVLGAEIADGRRSVNEARTLVDLPPVAGGDFHNVPSPKTAPEAAVPPTQGGTQ